VYDREGKPTKVTKGIGVLLYFVLFNFSVSDMSQQAFDATAGTLRVLPTKLLGVTLTEEWKNVSVRATHLADGACF
jgi:hypothetical protein